MTHYGKKTEEPYLAFSGGINIDASSPLGQMSVPPPFGLLLSLFPKKHAWACLAELQDYTQVASASEFFGFILFFISFYFLSFKKDLAKSLISPPLERKKRNMEETVGQVKIL